MQISRKQFLMTGLAAVGAADLGCGSDDPPAAPAGEGCQSSSATAVIGSNHGHSLLVSAADVAAGVAKTYSIQGSATHDHEVTLSSVHFTNLKARKELTLQSTPTDHTHPVTVRCA
jgi:hypothetical protein